MLPNFFFLLKVYDLYLVSTSKIENSLELWQRLIILFDRASECETGEVQMKASPVR